METVTKDLKDIFKSIPKKIGNEVLTVRYYDDRVEMTYEPKHGKKTSNFPVISSISFDFAVIKLNGYLKGILSGE